MKSLLNIALIAALALTSASAVMANDAHHPSASAQSTEAKVQPSDGEIKKVDKEAGKLTIKHGSLANLNMPGMTMRFQVKDPAWLDQVKAGDNVSFVAEKINDQYVVTKLEVKK